MHKAKPSRTAWAAASHRAAHQILEQGRIFRDPLAIRILGVTEAELLDAANAHPARRGMRIFIAVRSRIAEDALAAAVDGGVRQVVVLGAGLDTFAYRNPFGDRVRVFEVDHPATQAWKRDRLRDAGIALPASLTFAPVDFETDTLAAGLAASGFDSGVETFFTWLGVVPYLTEPSIWSTLAFIAAIPGGAHVVFDYGNPPETLSPEMRGAHDLRAARVETIGEAWVSYFDTDRLQDRLAMIGFAEIEDSGPRQIAARFFPQRTVTAPVNGGHILRAATIRRSRR
jgi:methyltransferase (TIGR00027 family)